MVLIVLLKHQIVIYLMFGYKKLTETGCYDVYLVKTNTAGIIEWEKSRMLILMGTLGVINREVE